MASFIIVAAILMGIFSTSNANDFTITWVQSPKESFNTWASRMRFQVNDKLVFKYNKAEDSVLVVKKEDYDSCNVKNPIQKLEDSSFQLTRSGPYYFITGVEEKCSKGEKLIVVVLSERNKKPVIPKPPTSPSLNPPTQSPTPSSSMAPSVSPPASSMAPSVSSSPSSSMAPSVSPLASSMAPSVSSSPSSSMAPSVSPLASSMAPSVSSSPSSSMAPSVSSSPSSSMAPSTNSQSPPSSLVSPMQAPSSFNGGGNEPAVSPTSAQNPKSSATALTASSGTIMMGAIIILGHALLG